MNISFITTNIFLGFSGLIAQVIFLRQLFLSFYGNELVIGLILFSWLFSESLGVFLAGKFFNKKFCNLNTAILLQLLFSFFIYFNLYILNNINNYLNINIGQGFGLNLIIANVFLCMFSVGFFHGCLISWSYYFFKDKSKEINNLASCVYSLQALGSLLGGMFFTFIFIPFLGIDKTFFCLIFLNLIFGMFLLTWEERSRHRIIWNGVFWVAIVLLFINNPISLHKKFLNSRFANSTKIYEKESNYGVVSINNANQQVDGYYNNHFLFSLPFVENSLTEDLAGLAYIYSETPKDVLVIGSGLNGLLYKLNDIHNGNIDYIEMDKLLVDTYKQQVHELGLVLKKDQVKYIFGDVRQYFSKSKKYDIIYTGVLEPQDLLSNKLFTYEFFNLVKTKLNDDGILTFAFNGSESYLSKQLIEANSIVFSTLAKTFDDIKIFPGDCNIYLAKNSKENNKRLVDVRVDEFYLKTVNLNKKFMLLSNMKYLTEKFSKEKSEKFFSNVTSNFEIINSDFKPILLYGCLKIWTAKFSKNFIFFLEIFSKVKMYLFLLGFSFIVILWFLFTRNKEVYALNYGISSTGFSSMLINLILMFMFQNSVGSLFTHVALLVSIFMFGLTIGSLIFNQLKVKKYTIKLFGLMELLVLMFMLFLLFFLGEKKYLFFVVFLFVCGILTSLEFPLTIRLLEQINKKTDVWGKVFCFDLFGASIAALLGSFYLLPVWGIKNCIIGLCFVKVLSVVFILSQNVFKKNI